MPECRICLFTENMHGRHRPRLWSRQLGVLYSGAEVKGWRLFYRLQYALAETYLCTSDTSEKWKMVSCDFYRRRWRIYRNRDRKSKTDRAKWEKHRIFDREITERNRLLKNESNRTFLYDHTAQTACYEGVFCSRTLSAGSAARSVQSIVGVNFKVGCKYYQGNRSPTRRTWTNRSFTCVAAS